MITRRRFHLFVVLGAGAALVGCGGGSTTTAPSSTGAKVVTPAFSRQVDAARGQPLAAVGPVARDAHAGRSRPSSAVKRAVCARDLAKVRANGPLPIKSFEPLHPSRAQLPRLAAFFERNQAVIRRLPAQLDALGKPDRGRAARDRLRALVDRNQANARAQLRAERAANVGQFVTSVKMARRLHHRFDAVGTAAGFPGSSPCAVLF